MKGSHFKKLLLVMLIFLMTVGIASATENATATEATSAGTSLTVITLIGGISFVTIMAIYRMKINGQTFDTDRYLRTFGYVAILAVTGYMTAGAVPDFSAILTTVMTGIPESSTLLTLASPAIVWVVNTALKSTASATGS